MTGEVSLTEQRHRIEMTTTIDGDVIEQTVSGWPHFMRMVLRTQELQIQAKLKELGWTSPEDLQTVKDKAAEDALDSAWKRVNLLPLALAIDFSVYMEVMKGLKKAVLGEDAP